jgi:type II secretory pathway pseudopilin PulG
MRQWIVLVPVIGMLAAAALPITRYAMKQRHEQTALEIMEDVRAAQERFREANGGYASDLASLVRPCHSTPAALGGSRLDELRSAGYVLTLRGEFSPAGPSGADCHARPLAADYFLTAAPVSAEEAAQQAFAARAQGDVVIFYDGIAPRPEDLATGLPTPAAERDTFKIP